MSQRGVAAAAGFGAVVWLAAAPFVTPPAPEIAWVERFVLLAVAVLAPLVLGAMGAGFPDGARADRWWLVAQPAAALLVAVSFVLEPGAWAAALAVPWLVLALLMALGGVARALTLVRLDGEEASFAVARVFLPVGAVWLVVSRTGAPFLGFHAPLPILTAVHFHYTAFAALALAGFLARVQPGRPVGAVVALAAVGTPVTATGITLQNQGVAAGAWTALAGAALVVAAFVLLAAATLWWALRHAVPIGPRIALAASGVLGLAGVPWGVVWAWDQAAGGPGLSILQMVRWHGAVNAAGFVLPALVAWTMLAPERAPRRSVRVAGLQAVQDRPVDVAPEAAGGQQLLPPEVSWRQRVPDANVAGLRAALLRFDVGLPGHVELSSSRDRVAAGDRVRQRVRLGPLRIEAELVVTEVLDDGPVRVACRTLPGHLVEGVKVYELRHEGGQAWLEMRSRSRPGPWLLRLLAPVVRRRQDRTNRAVLDRLAPAAS